MLKTEAVSLMTLGCSLSGPGDLFGFSFDNFFSMISLVISKWVIGTLHFFQILVEDLEVHE